LFTLILRLKPMSLTAQTLRRQALSGCQNL
jgi:hypothetical protein